MLGEGRNPRRCCSARVLHGRVSIRKQARSSENPDCLFRVARVFAALVYRQIAVIDLPENALPVVFERSEVALSVRVGVRGESIEGFHLFGMAD